MKITRRFLSAAAVTGLLSFCSFAQLKKPDSSAKPFEVRTNVRVLNSKDEPVNDLQVQDLKVFEDDVEQQLTYFARKEAALNLALVVDNSGSMRTQLPIITAASKALIRNLNLNDRVIVIRFVSSDKIEVLQDWTSNKGAAVAAIDNLFIEGGQSAVLDAIFLAAENLKGEQKFGGSKRFAAVVMSDLEEVESYHSLDKVLSLVKGSDIQIFPFALSQQLASEKRKGDAEKLAHTLAARTGGTAYVLDKKLTLEILAAKLTSLLTELRSQYVIGYVSTNPTRGTTRKLRVEVSDGSNAEKRKASMRESYFLP